MQSIPNPKKLVLFLNNVGIYLFKNLVYIERPRERY